MLVDQRNVAIIFRSEEKRFLMLQLRSTLEDKKHHEINWLTPDRLE